MLWLLQAAPSLLSRLVIPAAISLMTTDVGGNIECDGFFDVWQSLDRRGLMRKEMDIQAEGNLLQPLDF